jgi:hypothetical protein
MQPMKAITFKHCSTYFGSGNDSKHLKTLNHMLQVVVYFSFESTSSIDILLQNSKGNLQAKHLITGTVARRKQTFEKKSAPNSPVT